MQISSVVANAFALGTLASGVSIGHAVPTLISAGPALPYGPYLWRPGLYGSSPPPSQKGLSRFRHNVWPGANLSVYGLGPIGGKAGQLDLKAARAAQAGWSLPPRSVLAEGFFDDFFQSNGLGNNLREAVAEGVDYWDIRQAHLPAALLQRLRRIVEGSHHEHFLIRSSAVGEALGHGVYGSEPYLPKRINGQVVQAGIERPLLDVLASYFVNTARAFREVSQTLEGFGVILEPVVGNQFEYRGQYPKTFFGPVLSGFAVTSAKNGSPEISGLPGLFGGSKGGKKMKTFTRTGFDEAMQRSYHPSGLYQGFYYYDTPFDFFTGWDTPQGVFIKNLYESFVVEASLVEPYPVALETISSPIPGLFSLLEKTEGILHRPQYVEWAVTLDGQQPRFWLLQIADLEEDLHLFNVDFDALTDVIFRGNCVVGAARHPVKKVVIIRKANALRDLLRFNDQEKGFLLIYPEDMERAIFGKRGFTFSYVRNAIGAVQNGGSLGTWGHSSGLMRASRKIFGFLPEAGRFSGSKKKVGGLDIYEGDFEIVADAANGIFVLRESSSD